VNEVTGKLAAFFVGAALGMVIFKNRGLFAKKNSPTKQPWRTRILKRPVNPKASSFRYVEGFD
jgi:hypothetical protein